MRRMGPGDYFVATTSLGLFQLKILPELNTVFCKLLRIGRWKRGVFEIRPECDPTKEYTSPPWARIILRSAQVKEGVESATIKAAWLDECGMDMFKLHIWEAIQRRLSLYEGRVLGTTTLYNKGWVKSQIYDRFIKGDPDYDCIQFASYVNPAFPRREFERIIRTLPMWKVRMMYQGMFAEPPGLIYNCFTEKHVIRGFEPPLHWPVLVGIDPIGSVTAAVYLAYDPEYGQLHLYDEYYEPFGKTTREHAHEIKRRIAGRRQIVGFVGGGPSERQARLDWTELGGIKMAPPPFYDVGGGIERIYALFKDMGLLVHDKCSHFIDEAGQYSRVMLEDGTVTMEIENKGFNDHILDSLRYAVAHLTGPGPVMTRITPPAVIGRY